VIATLYQLYCSEMEQSAGPGVDAAEQAGQSAPMLPS